MPNRIAIFTVILSGVVSACASYIASRISQYQQRRLATENYKLAIITEIRALHHHLLRYEQVLNERVLTGEMSGARVLDILLQPGDMVVFSNNASAIGLFDNRTALRVLRFYSDVRILEGHGRVLSELVAETGKRPSERDVRHHHAMLRRTQRRAGILVRRLKQRDFVTKVLLLLRRRLRAVLRLS